MSSILANKFASLSLARDNQDPAINLIEGTKHPFWDIAEPDESRWDKSFPYQLMILKRVGSGYQKVPGGTFTLPIPPQTLNISMPFASSVEVTNGGIAEHNNGIPIKPITFRGTTGVLPGRGTGGVLTTPNLAQSIFAGTINAAIGTARTAASIVAPASGTNLVTDAELQADLKGTTGYLQFLLLQNFLERYAHLKSKKAGADYRLAFCIWKTKEIYLVTPVQFDLQRDAQRPLRFDYSFSMKAWRRITLDQTVVADTRRSATRDPGLLQTILTRLDTARRTLYGVQATLEAAVRDVESAVTEPLRSVILLLKDLLGVGLTISDLTESIIRDMGSAIVNGIETIAAMPEAREFQAQIDAIRGYSIGSSQSETRGGSLHRPRHLRDDAPDPGNRILANPRENMLMFSFINVGSLNLSPAVTKKIVAERERVRLLTRRDFESMRDTMVATLTDFEAAIGVGSARYAEVYGRNAGEPRAATESDFDAIFALNTVIMEMNRLAADPNVSKSGPSTLEYVAGLATRSGIAFEVPQSYMMVPFPYGHTLEQVAALYLGDASRWHEIATLNRLRAPFVDEVGLEQPLLTNGNGNQVTVADAGSMYPGQAVTLYSSTVTRTKRRITGIRGIAPGMTVLTLDGDADLGRFTTAAGAKIHIFTPDTVNSQMLIAIPSASTVPPGEEPRTYSGLDEFDTMLRVGGVDLLITPSGDAAITPDGDWRFAYGLTNIVQRVRMYFATPRGALLHHKTYGFPLRAGDSTADASAQEILAAAKDLLTFDSVFTAVRNAEVLKQGPVTRLSLSLEVQGASNLVPITVDVKR